MEFLSIILTLISNSIHEDYIKKWTLLPASLVFHKRAMTANTQLLPNARECGK